jgi:hypothetical protein
MIKHKPLPKLLHVPCVLILVSTCSSSCRGLAGTHSCHPHKSRMPKDHHKSVAVSVSSFLRTPQLLATTRLEKERKKNYMDPPTRKSGQKSRDGVYLKSCFLGTKQIQ